MADEIDQPFLSPEAKKYFAIAIGSIIGLEIVTRFLNYIFFSVLVFGGESSMYFVVLLVSGLLRFADIGIVIWAMKRVGDCARPVFNLSWPLAALLGLLLIIHLGAGLPLVSGVRFSAHDKLFTLLLFQCGIGPIAEEIVFRGMLFSVFRYRFGLLTAALGSSALFAMAHLGNSAPLTWILIPFAGSFAMSFIYERWNSLLLCAGLHMAFNFAALVAFA